MPLTSCALSHRWSRWLYPNTRSSLLPSIHIIPSNDNFTAVVDILMHVLISCMQPAFILYSLPCVSALVIAAGAGPP